MTPSLFLPFALKVYVRLLIFASLYVTNCGATSAVPNILASGQTSVYLEVTAQDSNNWKATSVAITDPASPTTEKVLSSPLGTAAPSQYFAFVGLSPATKYAMTITAALGGTGADTAFATPNPVVSVCTEADPLTGLEVDATGTTDEAIKIKWTAVAAASHYKVYIDDEEIDGNVVNTASDFTFDATTLDGKPVSLSSGTVHTCKVEVVITVTGCTGDAVTTSSQISCALAATTAKTTANEECKSIAGRSLPTVVLCFFSIIAIYI